MKIFIFIFIFWPKFLYILAQELYIPYSNYNNPSINSIYGTGNRTLDTLYKERCAKLWGEKSYRDEHCCEGDTLEEEKRQSIFRCQEILGNLQHYIIALILILYLILLAITMGVVFILYYCQTKVVRYKSKNALSSSMIVLFGATIIPIVILELYCWYKKITIEDFFGADFDNFCKRRKNKPNENVNEVQINPNKINVKNRNNKNIKFNDKNNFENINEIDIIPATSHRGLDKKKTEINNYI